MAGGVIRGASCAGALGVVFTLFAVASAQTITLQILLTGTPTSLAGFIQAVKPPDEGAQFTTSSSQLAAVRLYGSKELMAANLPTQGVTLLPWTGANPSGALLLFKDRVENIIIQNSNFWNLPAPALAVSNSSVTIINSTFDQNMRWGPRVAVVSQGASLYVSGSNFTNAYCAKDGGAIHASRGSSVALTNAIFDSNTAGGNGGAIYADTDSQILSDASSFSNNSAGLNGGAVYHNGFFPSMAGGDLGQLASTLRLEPEVGANIISYSASAFALLHSIFTANRAAFSGGAVYQEYATGSMKDCRFVANSAKLYGGAVAQSSIFGAVQTSNFQSNTALHGGGAYQLNVVGAVERGVFSQNVAGATAGALYRLRCTGDVNGSSFANDAAEHGGGLNLVRSSVNHINNNTFTGEQVKDSGAGIYARSSLIGNISYNAFSSMAASHGAGIYLEQTVVQSGISYNNFTYSVAKMSGGGMKAVNSTLSDVTANIFLGNQAGQSGGGLALNDSTATVKGNSFTDNLISKYPEAAGRALIATGGSVTGAESNVYIPVKGGFIVQ